MFKKRTECSQKQLRAAQNPSKHFKLAIKYFRFSPRCKQKFLQQISQSAQSKKKKTFLKSHKTINCFFLSLNFANALEHISVLWFSVNSVNPSLSQRDIFPSTTIDIETSFHAN